MIVYKVRKMKHIEGIPIEFIRTSKIDSEKDYEIHIFSISQELMGGR